MGTSYLEAPERGEKGSFRVLLLIDIAAADGAYESRDDTPVIKANCDDRGREGVPVQIEFFHILEHFVLS